MSTKSLDQQITEAADLNVNALIDIILKLDCGFPIDLSPEYLSSLSLDRLQHLYMALLLHARPKESRLGQSGTGH